LAGNFRQSGNYTITEFSANLHWGEAVCYASGNIKKWADAHANLPTGQGGRESG
jgi:hypothetical protein